jgi:hypothetical protein
MGKLIGAYIKKLDDEACLEALRSMACGSSNKAVVAMLSQKYKIDITSSRLSALKCQKKWVEIYDRMRLEYLAQVGDLTRYEVANKGARLERMQELLELAVERGDFDSFKDKAETVLKILKEARTESESVAVASQKSQSLIQYADKVQIVNKEKEQNKIKNVIPGEIIDESSNETPKP